MVAAGEELSSSFATVSFDLFDTLLIRRVHDPDLVKLPVARFVSVLARRKGLDISWEQVQKIRDEVEQRHRQTTGEKFKDYEACYPQFMGEALAVIFADLMTDDILSEVTAYELEMESSMLVPRQLLVDWLVDLHQAGKQVMVISDVYLPASFLEKLLDRAGFLSSIDKVISSADSFKAKASGEAWPMIKEEYGLQTDKWLHIGDNPISDGVRPHEFGITSFIIEDFREQQRKSIVKRMVNYSKGRHFWRGRALQQLMLPLEGENKPCSMLYREGYNFVAPLLGMFLEDIGEKCRQYGIDKIFFLSREGYIFKEFWQRMTPCIDPAKELPAHEYLYVSRMALAGASCAYQGLTRDNASIVFLPAGNRDFRDVCRVFSLDIDGLLPFLSRHGLQPDTVLSAAHDGYQQSHIDNFYNLLEDGEFQEEIKKQTKPMNDALCRYLDDVGFFSLEKAALVDIGWLGTIPRFFYDAIRHRAEHPVCYNFMFGATRGIPYPELEKNKLFGLVYDKVCFNFSASTILYARDFFEEACRAPHPTLNGYKCTDDGGYELIFRHTDDELGLKEQEQDKYFSPLQEGVLDGASRYGAASALLGYKSYEYRAWFNYVMVSKMAFPRTEEVVAIRHKNHLDDFHGTHVPASSFKQKGAKGLWDYSESALRWIPFLRLRKFISHLRSVINS